MSIYHFWTILGLSIWISATCCLGQTPQNQPGFVSLVSIAFKHNEPGFIDFVHDISENPFTTPATIEAIQSHQVKYELDPFYTQEEGLNPEERPIDGVIAPAVVYVSGSNPVMGATFYVRCSNDLTVTPVWTYKVDGMLYEMKFPTKRCVTSGVFSSNGLGPEFMSYYDFEESEDSFPVDWTLAYEGTSTISFRVSEYQQVSLPGGPPQSPTELSTVVTGTVDAYILAKAHTPSTTLTARGGIPLLYRYSSIRNGCFHGRNTNSYIKWLDNTFLNYFYPLNAKRGKDGIDLEYWDRGMDICGNLSEFFTLGDGKCGLFSDYLADIIVCQGYPYQHSQEVTLYSKLNELGNLTWSALERIKLNDAIKNRFGRSATKSFLYSGPVFAAIRSSPFAPYVPYFLSYPPGASQYPRNYDIVPPSGMAQEDIVVPGQNNPTPRHLFHNHQLHVVNNRVLDPSYGYWNVDFPAISGIGLEENDAIHIVRAALVEVTYSSRGVSRIVPCLIPISINDSSTPDLFQN